MQTASDAHAGEPGPAELEALLALTRRVRARTRQLVEGLSPEDCQPQPATFASPLKWHLAHTSWYFETFVLEAGETPFAPFHPRFRELFNSYYHRVGPRPERSERGLVTRPGLDEVLAYRADVDARLARWLAGSPSRELLSVLEVGLAHEQQHQELMLTDGKYLLAQNPLQPAWRDGAREPTGLPPALRWHPRGGGRATQGHDGDGFAFDNELPAHEVLLAPFALASRPATVAEYLDFMADGGYGDPRLWLSDGWEQRQLHGWEAPLYWEERDGGWTWFSHRGREAVDPHAPVTHISLYEADAFARWSGARLPTEAEWEAFAREAPVAGNLADDGHWEPRPGVARREGPQQLFGDVWEWTQSAYAPYPGYRPPGGALGEYNGKFMVNQVVLKGGSCATPAGHLRASYRNFFHPEMRWQFSGVRLAKDA